MGSVSRRNREVGSRWKGDYGSDSQFSGFGLHHAEKRTAQSVKGGTKYALVVGKRVYMLAGHEAELDKVAGMKAKVKGKMSAETLTVQSVVPAMKMN
jgi:hypothetical protein